MRSGGRQRVRAVGLSKAGLELWRIESEWGQAAAATRRTTTGHVHRLQRDVVWLGTQMLQLPNADVCNYCA